MIHTEAGYHTSVALPPGDLGSSFAHLWYLKDHLGNNRVFANESGNVLAAYDYDPFGVDISVLSSGFPPFPTFPSPQGSPYKYGGKEWSTTTSTYDFEARQFSPNYHRFTTMDPLAEKYYGISPYAYCANNPVNLVDLTGKEIGWPETIRFVLTYPNIAPFIGAVSKGSNNISTISVRYSTREYENGESILQNSQNNEVKDDRGTQVGAFRHALWQSMITSQFTPTIAKEAGDAHESNPNVDLTQRQFRDLDEADQVVDLLNNIIGRNIGLSSFGLSNKDIALKVLETFYRDGLYTASRDDKGDWTVERTTITDQQYRAMKVRIFNSDHYGR